jgi:Zn-dependent protease
MRPTPLTDFKQFTPEARRVLAIAGKKAQYSQISAVTTEHLLLGLFLVEGGAVYEIIKALKIDLSHVQHTLEAALNLSTEVRVEQVGLTPRVKAIVEQAVRESQQLRHKQVGTEHLLMALLSHTDLPSYTVLTDLGLTIEVIHAQLSIKADGMPTWWPQWIPVSPIFVVLVLVTTVAGVLLYQQIGYPALMLALFVMGGWLITLVLHEFGHAFVAFHGGDQSVRQKGYLTLNPFKYTHPMLSIALPLLFVLMGGIGFPGGAVFIQSHRLRSKAWRSLVSAAGPLMTVACLLVTSSPFLFGTPLSNDTRHLEFWAGVALLAYLQLTSLILTLLPLPPLDGFGIIAPYLPESVLKRLSGIGEYGFLLLYLVLLVPNPLADGFWVIISVGQGWLRLNPSLISIGFTLFRFWE